MSVFQDGVTYVKGVLYTYISQFIINDITKDIDTKMCWVTYVGRRAVIPSLGVIVQELLHVKLSGNSLNPVLLCFYGGFIIYA